MKASEIRELTDEEMELKLDELRRDYLNVRFQLTTMQLENKSQVRKVKRDIARIHTIKTEREKAKKNVESA